jgi:hypothetical protein
MEKKIKVALLERYYHHPKIVSLHARRIDVDNFESV